MSHGLNALEKDVMGFSREARAGKRTLDQYRRSCLELMSRLDDRAAETGGRYSDEDHALYLQVMAREIPCPFMDDCPRYRRAIEKGGKSIGVQPRLF